MDGKGVLKSTENPLEKIIKSTNRTSKVDVETWVIQASIFNCKDTRKVVEIAYSSYAWIDTKHNL